MVEFNNIWLSSIDHLNTFIELTKSKDKKLIKKSYISKVRIMFDQVPVVFYSKGNLSINEHEIIFTSLQPKRGLLKEYINLNNDLHIKIEFDQIEEITRYRHSSPFIEYYNTGWIQIKYIKNTISEDILISQGGYGPSMKKIKEGTDEIYNELKSNTL
ncbi:hypothetical protein [Paenibacillus sp. FSL K6-2524]|uniref:hypothetical protein n=1 Tax=Paenibacillus sp. FSL K6-2524 TaxID=2954516 RepID=UPI0030F8B8D7